MRYSEIITEAPMPSGFLHSDWGYWIEPDGKMLSVGRHSHYLHYRIGWEVFASGRIRVTSISDPSKVKTDAGLRVLAANFFANFVTQWALRSLLSLLSNYDFDTYSIAGMTFRDPADMRMPEDVDLETWDKIRTDPRSVIDNDSKSAALRSVRAFLATARNEPPPQLDANPRGKGAKTGFTEAEKRPAAIKPTAYEVVRYDGPANVSDTILDKIVIHAADKNELIAKIKAWMEQIGLDPDDEDDQSYVVWHGLKK